MTSKICFNLKAPPNDTSSAAFGTASCFLAFYGQPSIVLSGLVLNWTCIFIFCAKTKAKALGIHLVPYLIALCTFDSAQLLLSVFVLNFPVIQQFVQTTYYTEIDKWLFLNELSVYSIKWLMPILMSVNYCSVWTITSISIERFKAICHPFGSTVDRPVLSIIIIVICALGLNIIRYWEYEVRTIQLIDTSNQSLRISFLVGSELKQNSIYQILIDTVIYGGLVYFVPIVTLIYLNCRILRQIWKTRQLMKATMRKSQYGSRINRRKSEDNHFRSACMIITIITVFFLCHTGGLVLRFFLNDDQWKTDHYLEFHFLSDVSNLLINLNSTINPLLYFVFTRKFRDLTRERRKSTATSEILASEARLLINDKRRASVLSSVTDRNPLLLLPRKEVRSHSVTNADFFRGRSSSYVKNVVDSNMLHVDMGVKL